jgi:hypothetical protein
MPKFSADPLYLGDADDDYDSTYAFIYFRVPDPVPAELLANCPEDLREPTVLLARLRELAKPPVDMRARWESALKAMERP